jgi:hypothetical protein
MELARLRLLLLAAVLAVVATVDPAVVVERFDITQIKLLPQVKMQQSLLVRVVQVVVGFLVASKERTEQQPQSRGR